MIRIFPSQGLSLPISVESDWIMTISAFFDESGKFKDRKYVCFGGVSSFSKEFELFFAPEWGRLLYLCGLHKKGLSAKDALNHNRPLSAKEPALGLRKRINALLPFIACIRRHLQVVTGAVVEVGEFKKLPSHFFQYFGDDPIYMAFARSILRVLEFTENDQIVFICDEDEETVIPFYKIYKRIKKEWPNARKKLAAISFADDKAVFGLQAADLIAALVRLEKTCAVDHERFLYRPLFNALTKDPDPQKERLWEMGIAAGEKANLRRLAEHLKKDFQKRLEMVREEEAKKKMR